MIERFKVLFKSFGAVENFYLFSEDLCQAGWEQLEWSYKGMFNGMEKKNQLSEKKKSLLDSHDLLQRQIQGLQEDGVS